MDLLKSLKASTALLGGFALLFLQGCLPDTSIQEQRYQGRELGTTYSIIFYGESGTNWGSKIDSVFLVINQSMSTYQEGSIISRINRGERNVRVDRQFKEVFFLSQDVHRRSKGYFDPTVGMLVDAWGFGPGEQQELDSVKVDSLLQFVGLDKVTLKSDRMVEKEKPEIRIDFNAVAKGYAIDRIGKMLENNGVNSYLVEVGGEVLGRDRKWAPQELDPESTDSIALDSPSLVWKVGIDDPQAEGNRELKKIIYLKDKALASSGNYRKFRVDEETGKKYVHTINPLTGFTENGSVLATSVLAENCAKADAFATAFMAMPLQESIALLKESEDLEGYIIYLNEEGEVEEYMTPGFTAAVVPQG
jgi:thiamine biosynthesis lipoprotein